VEYKSSYFFGTSQHKTIHKHNSFFNNWCLQQAPSTYKTRCLQ